MTLSLYEDSVPALFHGLRALSNILDRGELYAIECNVDPAALIRARLVPDMFSLSQQVQQCVVTAIRGAARLAGIELPPIPDVQQTFAGLHDQLADAISYLEAIKPEQIVGREKLPVEMRMRGGELIEFTGQRLLRTFILPNFYFHVTTAYLILRHRGVQLGKSDFLNLS